MKKTLILVALGISAAAFLTAQGLTALVGKVPVDFRVATKTFDAGAYRLTAQRPGVVTVTNERGNSSAFALLPVQTESDRVRRNSLTFKRSSAGATYALAGYCISGQGCWSTMEGAKKSVTGEKVEIAILVAR